MINYTYTNDEGITQKRKKEVQLIFNKKYEAFIQEIDDKNGIVNINFAITDLDDTRFYILNFPNHDIGEFIARVHEYNKVQQP